MSNTLNLQKLVTFAQQVGADYKSLVDKIKAVETAINGKATEQQITQKVNELKNELLNGVGAEFDTLKELADELKNLSTATGAGGAILTKLTELSGKFDALTELDLVETYTRAKNGEN